MQPIRASCAGASNLVSTGSGCVPSAPSKTSRLHQAQRLPPTSRARASAQHLFPQNLAVPAPAALSCLCSAPALRFRSAAAGCADRLYGVCNNVKHGGANGGALFVVTRLSPAEVLSAERRILPIEPLALYGLSYEADSGSE